MSLASVNAVVRTWCDDAIEHAHIYSYIKVKHAYSSCQLMSCLPVHLFNHASTVNSLCDNCPDQICPYINLSLLRGTTAVRMQ